MTSNINCSGYTLRIAVGITMLLLLLAGIAGAVPYAYITNLNSNSVSVIDTASNTVTATVNVGINPYGVAVNPAGTKVYVVNRVSNNVSVIDTGTNIVSATVNVGLTPFGVAVNPAGTKVYVTNQGSFTVSVIDTASNAVTATVNLGSAPWGVAVNPAGTKVYVANGSNSVSVIDTVTNTVIATVNVGSAPFGVAVNPAGTKVYVTNQVSNNVSVIDPATNIVTATVNVGITPFGIAVNPAGTKVYVANEGSNNVSVIDTTSNAVTTVNVGSNPYGIAVNPAGTKVYVANQGSNSVSVIDTTSNAVTAIVTVGVSPIAFGQFIGPEANQTNAANATICGVKFNDLNGNGIQDAGEPLLPDWIIQIIYPNGTVAANVTTNDRSGYCVTVPDGTYTISEVPQSGWTQTYPPQSPLSPGTYTVNLTAGRTMQNVSFGNMMNRTNNVTDATICGVKFNDLNGNHVRDAGEPLLPDWIIQIIYPNGTVAANVSTNARDGYCVNLPAGTYSISEVPQSGWTQTYPPQSLLSPGTYTVNLTAGQTMQNVSFGNNGNKTTNVTNDTVCGGTNAWSPLGTGMNGEVWSLAVIGTDLYAGGVFTTAGGNAANYIAKWNGTSWSSLGSGINNGPNAGGVWSLAVIGTDLYASGWFTTAGGIPAENIAKWDGTSWSALGNGLPASGSIHALAVMGNNLYAGGYIFTTALGGPGDLIVKWDGTNWSAVSGMNDAINSLMVNGTDLYAGGQFTIAGTVPANHIAKWNGISWSPLGTGMDFGIGGNGLQMMAGNLYAGGIFTTAGGNSSNYIAKWDGSTWYPFINGIHNGMNNEVEGFAVIGTDLYASGSFTTAGGINANSVAKWDGINWSPLGTGMNDGVWRLAFIGNDLYAGGIFTTAGSENAMYVAKWGCKQNISGVNLALSKSAPISMEHGKNMTYILYSYNFGDTIAYNVTLNDTLPLNVVFISASDGGIFDPSTRNVTWNMGNIPGFATNMMTVNVNIPGSVTVGTVIKNIASISTITPEILYDDNNASVNTTVTSSTLPDNVSIEPTNGNPGGTTSVFWLNPITFSYHSCNTTTAVNITIHVDGFPDIIETMTGPGPDWTYTTTLYPTHGLATITFDVTGCGETPIVFNLYIDPAGYIYDANTGLRIAGATVTLQRFNTSTMSWENVLTGPQPPLNIPIMIPDINPLITGIDGQYQWDTLAGTYRVNVTAPGYYPGDSIVVTVPPPVTDLNVGLSPIATPTPPDSITNLHNITFAQTYINWTWTNPADKGFDKVMIYLDGSFKTNVTKGFQYYNATGLTAGTMHTIATRTVDTSGNINTTWVNHTSRTANAATSSIISVTITPTNPSAGDQINITVTINNPGASFNGTVEGNVWLPSGTGKYIGWKNMVIPTGTSTATIIGAAGGAKSSYITHEQGTYYYDVFLENADKREYYGTATDSRRNVAFTVGAAASVYMSNITLSSAPTNGSVMTLNVTISNPTASAFTGTMNANIWDSARGYTLTTQHISITARGSTKLTFSYTPVNTGLHSYDFFMVSSVSGQNTKAPWNFPCMDYVAGIGFTVG